MNTWNAFTGLFIAMLAASLLLELWLASRNARHVLAHRKAVPAPFRGRIALAAHRRSADYTVAKMRFARISALYGAALVLAWTVGGWLNALDLWTRSLGWAALPTGLVFLLAMLVLNELLELPLALYGTFEIEERFGFNRMTPALFISDQLKKLMLLLLFSAPLAAAALWLIARAGTLWWAWVWLLWMAFTIFITWAYPTLIAPLFNRFRPLRSRALRARILKLLKRTGFRSQGIYVIDSSRRTTHGNAYFAGFGRAKRIVFFDSLLKALRPTEIEAVVAHELGHFRLRHIAKRLLLFAVTSFLALLVLGNIMREPWFYHGLGVSQPSAHVALALFLLAGPVFSFFLQPWMARGSRRHEFQADAFAVQETSARALGNALVKLYRDNATSLTPDPLFSAFYDTHPPALQRIAQLGRR